MARYCISHRHWVGNGGSIGWGVGPMESQQCAPFMDVGASEMPRAGAFTPEAGCSPQVAFLGVPLQVGTQPHLHAAEESSKAQMCWKHDFSFFNYSSDSCFSSQIPSERI